MVVHHCVPEVIRHARQVRERYPPEKQLSGGIKAVLRNDVPREPVANETASWTRPRSGRIVDLRGKLGKISVPHFGRRDRGDGRSSEPFALSFVIEEPKRAIASVIQLRDHNGPADGDA